MIVFVLFASCLVCSWTGDRQRSGGALPWYHYQCLPHWVRDSKQAPLFVCFGLVESLLCISRADPCLFQQYRCEGFLWKCIEPHLTSVLSRSVKELPCVLGTTATWTALDTQIMSRTWSQDVHLWMDSWAVNEGQDCWLLSWTVVLPPMCEEHARWMEEFWWSLHQMDPWLRLVSTFFCRSRPEPQSER